MTLPACSSTHASSSGAPAGGAASREAEAGAAADGIFRRLSACCK